jgi:hypothetical protein
LLSDRKPSTTLCRTLEENVQENEARGASEVDVVDEEDEEEEGGIRPTVTQRSRRTDV